MSKIAVLRDALLQLLGEHERTGALPTSNRFLFYELVARGVIGKEKQPGTQDPAITAETALTQLRKSGQVPWDWIVDETRAVENYSGFSSIEQAMLEHLPGARLDPWAGTTVLILTESRSLAGVLRQIAWD